MQIMPTGMYMNGLAFIWNPDLSQLGNASVWLAAAGQIFLYFISWNGNNTGLRKLP